MDITTIDFDIEMFLIYLIVIEAILITICVITLFLIRFWQESDNKREKTRQQQISLIILDAMETDNPEPLIKLLKPYKGTEMLLHQVEAFDRRFTGALWEEIKSTILRSQLLPAARSRYNSFSWIKRNYAARCFSLEPFPIDESKFLKLLDDPVFLVKSAAASAVVKLGIDSGILKIIDYMSKHEGYSRYFF